MVLPKERLTIVQYAGDFREAALRLAEGGPETYRAQKYTVNYVENLSDRYDVTTITAMTDDEYDVTLASGARAIGAGLSGKFRSSKVIELIRRTNPDRLVLRMPNLMLLRWVALSGIPTLALLADSFPARNIKERLKRRLVVHYLKSPNISLIANHGRRSARQLVDIGVPAEKVVAWDFPAQDTPYHRPAKSAATGRRIMFAGMLSAAKGVDDLLEATAMFKQKGQPIEVDLYGNGETDRLKQLVTRLGIGQEVAFRGLIPNSQMVPTMAAADIIVVPSRHEYSEGLPLTIYESLCSRTPLVASDHPMFLENIQDGFSCLMFRGSDAGELAGKIDALLSNPTLYGAISGNAPQAWESIQIPLKWSDLIETWLTNKHMQDVKPQALQ